MQVSEKNWVRHTWTDQMRRRKNFQSLLHLEWLKEWGGRGRDRAMLEGEASRTKRGKKVWYRVARRVASRRVTADQRQFFRVVKN